MKRFLVDVIVILVFYLRRNVGKLYGFVKLLDEVHIVITISSQGFLLYLHPCSQLLKCKAVVISCIFLFTNSALLPTMYL